MAIFTTVYNETMLMSKHCSYI